MSPPLKATNTYWTVSRSSLKLNLWWTFTQHLNSTTHYLITSHNLLKQRENTKWGGGWLQKGYLRYNWISFLPSFFWCFWCWLWCRRVNDTLPCPWHLSEIKWGLGWTLINEIKLRLDFLIRCQDVAIVRKNKIILLCGSGYQKKRTGRAVSVKWEKLRWFIAVLQKA